MRVMFAGRAIDRMAGGVERMMATVMNALVRRGHEVDLLTWDRDDAAPFFPIDERVSWHRLALGDPSVRAGLRLRLRRAAAVRSLIRDRRPEAVVCFQDGPFMALRAYTLGQGVPIIVAERNAPTRFDHLRSRRKGLTFFAFRFARRVLVQCESYRDMYPAYLRDRIVTIPNPVHPAPLKAAPGRPGPSGRYRLLSVGRLGYQKNFQALIGAFARIAPDFDDWDMVIVGDGEDRDSLAQLVARQQLSTRVQLPGTTSDVSSWYSSSHLFCLPSRWEGFPNALAEALSHGLPVVGFAGCAGTRDLVRAEHNGLLAAGNGDPVSLAASLARLMGDHSIRETMGSAAVSSVSAFEPERVFSCWEQMLLDAIRE